MNNDRQLNHQYRYGDLEDTLSRYECIIAEKDKIIDELLVENAKYKELYLEHRARQDCGC